MTTDLPDHERTDNKLTDNELTNNERTFPPYDVDHVVPHCAPMSLLDRIEHWSGEQLQAEVTIRPGAPFADASGMPGWVGIEYMAQAVAAYAGCCARSDKQAVKIGFLVGSRRYDCSHSHFPLGAKLEVRVKELIQVHNSLSVFQCRIDGTGEHADIEASANLNVFQPDDPEGFLRGEAP